MRNKRALALSVLIILALAASPVLGGELYKWKDENGVTHFSDSPPAEPGKGVETRQVEEGGSGDFDVMKNYPRADPLSPARARPKVEIYTTSWCPTCRKAKEFFSSRGIPFTEYDIEKDPAADARHDQLSPEGYVPVVLVNGRKSVGLKPDQILEALKAGE